MKHRFWLEKCDMRGGVVLITHERLPHAVSCDPIDSSSTDKLQSPLQYSASAIQGGEEGWLQDD